MKNAKKLIMLIGAFLLFMSEGKSQELSEVKIGGQIWAAKNLEATTFRNGDVILEAKTKKEWTKACNESIPCWSYYKFDSKNGDKYGKLYNIYAVNDKRGLAPMGWHIPSDAEWSLLTDILGGEKQAGKKMKSTGGWKGNGNGNNESGFNALPSGCMGSSAFMYKDKKCYLWSTKADYPWAAWIRIMSKGSEGVERKLLDNTVGLAVRCRKD